MWHGSTERVRLRLIAILQDRTYKELAPELGFNHETLRRQMLGLSAVSLELVMAVSVLRGVSIEWLLMGRGKP